MTILFLTNNYLPTPNANGVCIHSLAKECVKRGVETHVICTGTWKNSYWDEIDGVCVHHLRVPFYNLFLYYFENHKKTFLGKLTRIIGRLFALGKKLMHINEYPLQDNCLVRHYVKECKSIDFDSKKTIVVASFTPLEAVKAGVKLKQAFPDVRTIYYSLDTLSNECGFGFLPESVRKTIGLKQELKYFGLYDSVVLMNCHYKHYSDQIFDAERRKYKYADFPLFQPSAKTNHQPSYKIVYTGTLYRGIRNPRPAMELLSQILDKYSVHFYGHSDCDVILEEYSVKYPGHVTRHGLVTHQEAVNAIAEADILLSIGNAHTQMAPSKIFEQMSSGKPIIHTYAEETDPCLQELQKYGNALCVDINHVEDADLCGFVSNLRNLDNEELAHKFKEATSVYSIDLFMEKQ